MINSASIKSEIADPPGEAGGRYASEVIKGWPSDRMFDAREVILANPDLAKDKVFRIDVAYEEYRRRLESGESFDVDDFTARFPDIKYSLAWYISVIQHYEENAHLLPSCKVEWPEVGEMFLNFHLIADLGHGSFSRVYLARDVSLGHREVVVKICQRGAEEAAVLGQLMHPNIVPVLSANTDGEFGLSAICMPFLTCATLLQTLDFVWSAGKRPTSGETIRCAVDEANRQFARLIEPTSRNRFRGDFVDIVVAMGSQLADALHYSHERGIVHGDIKPSNVLVRPNGSALLFDFNLSFRAAGKNDNVGGTIPYMAPEQLQRILSKSGETGQLDARTDIFSLAVTLYEMLTGTLPFGPLPASQDRDEFVQTLYARQKQGPIAIRTCRPDIDPLVADIIESCLSFDPARRPASGAELATRLRSLVRPTTRVRRWAAKHPGFASVVIAGLVLSLAVVAGWLIMREPYAVRLTRRAEAAFQANDWGESIELINRALETSDDRSALLFARGRAYLARGDIRQAANDFEQVMAKVNDGRVSALLAYCVCLLDKDYERALSLYEKAENEGFVSAGLLNNMGYCYMRTMQSPKAEKTFKRALELDPHQQVTNAHIALLELQSAAIEQRVPDPRFIETAASSGPAYYDLYERLAMTYVVGLKNTPGDQQTQREELTDKAISAMELAIESGSGGSHLSERLLRVAPELNASRSFRELADKRNSFEMRKSLPHLVDPLGAQTEFLPLFNPQP